MVVGVNGVGKTTSIGKIANRLKKDGKKVVLISDFYFGKELLTPILNNLNLGQFIDEIFVSSDTGKRKSTGNLYKYVLEKECISSQQMLKNSAIKIILN